MQAITADSQLRLMQEQWDEERRGREEAEKPRIDLLVQSLHYGSFVTLFNRGTQVVVLRRVCMNEEPIDIQEFRWDKVGTPKLLSIPPEKESFLFHGVSDKVSFNGTRFVAFPEMDIEIEFNYGKETWRWAGKISLDTDGIFHLSGRLAGLVEGS
ncbi:hypothetical protein CVO96_20520 [Deinococcus koreensis]|uniref:Uncharacterized protein n=2 Tax=Deinococcus koreensis TaxID=2054903 RepID=A0A2K3URL7_9DEIO|nr:hypothetical protein CVO96_20520 [Deinococcus koreensis]